MSFQSGNFSSEHNLGLSPDPKRTETAKVVIEDVSRP